MGKALYRKYRPKSLTEVVGQKHVTDTLANAIKAGRISHAYLLTGPRGTGKTSIARILAHEVNGLSYDADTAQLDIIEIDAASNRRIDEIRELRDKVHILPTSNKYKVYIIDEVHMLTREAFNALLKTLEEPPEHVIFILATTEPHKLPETIVSRTQHFNFKPVDLNQVVDHLATIAKGENLQISPEALAMIAEHGNGSFRDSISLLDQARGLGQKVSAADVANLLGIPPDEATDQLLTTITSGDIKATLDALATLRGQGWQSGQLAKQLGNRIRQLIVNNIAYQNEHYVKLMNGLLSVSSSQHADRLLEIVLLDHIFNTTTVTTSVETAPTVPKSKLEPIKPVKPEPSFEEARPKVETTVAKPSEKTDDRTTPNVGQELSLESWPLVVAAIKKKHNTLYGILRMAEPRIDKDKLTLAFKFAFHQKQINNDKNRQIISDIVRDLTGQTVSITCIIGQTEAPVNNSTKHNNVNNVSDIFGGAELLES